MEILKRTFSEFSEDDCPRMAAALAYYTVFALPPMLVIILMVTGFFVNPDDVMALLESQLGSEAANQAQTMVEYASQQVSGGASLALVFSILALVFSATGAFAQFQTALNAAWEVEPDPEQKGFGKFARIVTKRLLSLSMVLVVAFLLVVALAVSGIISTFTQPIVGFLADIGLPGLAGRVIVWAADALVFTVVLWLLFAALFKVLPDVRLSWKDVRVGALVTAILFVIGKLVVGWYIGQSDPGSAFGAAGALAVIMLFVYYASMIVLLGAEFTQVWASEHGHVLRPAKHAVKVIQHKEYERAGTYAAGGSTAGGSDR